MARILILGGTGEAAALAANLSSVPFLEVISSLAGRTREPLKLAGAVRSGGFGGAEGLAAYIRAESIDILMDATHPFAEQISWNAAAAAQATGIAYLRLARPAWEKVEGDRWIEVNSVEAAALAIPAVAQRVFLTIGRQQLASFAALTHLWFLMRAIDPPDANMPLPQGKLLLKRGPFSLAQEQQLLKMYQIDGVVSKNSGGAATYAKIVAARALHIPVVMVQRPAMPPVATVADVEGAIAWLQQILSVDLTIPRES